MLEQVSKLYETLTILYNKKIIIYCIMLVDNFSTAVCLSE